MGTTPSKKGEGCDNQKETSHGNREKKKRDDGTRMTGEREWVPKGEKQ